VRIAGILAATVLPAKVTPMSYGQITQVYSFGVDVWDLEGRYRYPADLSRVSDRPSLGDLVVFELGTDGFAHVERRIPDSELPAGLQALPRPEPADDDYSVTGSL
jgi:hypothetical protein